MEHGPAYTSEQGPPVPSIINGYPVVASIRQWFTRDGYHPHGHVVTCLMDSGKYVTWFVCMAPDQLLHLESTVWRWVADLGHPDIGTFTDAVADMTYRAARTEGLLLPPVP